MRPISKKNRRAIDEDPYFKICVRRGEGCDGRITIEHAFIYAGRQVDELWAFVPLCWRHHLGDGFVKEIGQFKALDRLSNKEIEKIQKQYDRVDWSKLKIKLTKQCKKLSSG